MDLDKEAIREIILQTISELKRAGYLRDYDDLAYSEASSILRAYYGDGETDEAVGRALKAIEDDQYSRIISLYFRDECTIEKLAELFNVEVSTIARNKKRLCLKIFEQIDRL